MKSFQIEQLAFDVKEGKKLIPELEKEADEIVTILKLSK